MLAFIIIVKGIIFAIAIYLTLSICVDAKKQVNTSGKKVVAMILSWVAYSTMWAIYFAKVMG